MTRLLTFMSLLIACNPDEKGTETAEPADPVDADGDDWGSPWTTNHPWGIGSALRMWVR